jgi:hypothetical protein
MYQRRGNVILPNFFHTIKNTITEIANKASTEIPQLFNAVKNLGLTVDKTVLTSLASKLTPPVIAILGVALVATIIYMIYKIVKNPDKVQEVKRDLLAKLHSIAPDLFKIDGWKQKISDKLDNSITGSPANIVANVSDIFKEVALIGEKTNAGGKLRIKKYKKKRKGGNIMMAMN